MKKNVLIIGGYCSIGRKIIQDLKDQNYNIVATSSNLNNLESYSKELNVSFVYLNVTDQASIEKVLSPDSGFEAVVYLAAKHYFNTIRNFSADKALNTIHINALGLISISKAFLKSTAQSKDGRDRSIVYISSLAAHMHETGLLDYSMSKALGSEIVKNLALELSKFKIRINAISPGWIQSERSNSVSSLVGENNKDAILSKYPLGAGTPVDISYFVESLISEKARWITGQDIVLDGGRCLL